MIYDLGQNYQVKCLLYKCLYSFSVSVNLKDRQTVPVDL